MRKLAAARGDLALRGAATAILYHDGSNSGRLEKDKVFGPGGHAIRLLPGAGASGR